MEILPRLIFIIILATTPALANKNFVDDELPIFKRDTSYLDQCSQLDGAISHLSNAIPAQIDRAKDKIESGLRFTAFQKTTRGWANILAALKNIYADLVTKDIDMEAVQYSDIYSYGITFGLGLGFGAPNLFTSPDPNLSCGSADYLHVLNKYGLNYGIENLMYKVGSKAARSLVNEFQAWAKLQVKCILDNSASSEEAFAVGCSIDELVTAYILKLDLIDKGECYSTNLYSHQDHSSLKKRISTIEQNPEAISEDEDIIKYLVDSLASQVAITPMEASNAF